MTSSTQEPENKVEQPKKSNRHSNSRAAKKSTPKSAILKSKAQFAFFISVIIIVLILVPFTTETYKYVQDFKRKKPEGYEWPSIQDFWFTAVAACVFWSLEQAFQYALYPWYLQHCKEQNDLEIRDQRTRKAVTNIYKCCYYTASSFFGWYALKDSYILPPALGGKGSLDLLFTDFPYITPPPLYNFYFTGTMGYHIGSLLHHLFSHKKSNDYLEMMFHHLITFYLYAFSYMSNTLIGAVIAYIHDIGDIGVTWTRSWSESNYKLTTAISFVFTLVAWFYTRLTMLPWCIYVATIKLEVYTISPYIQPIFGFLLTCLFVLHIYWFILCLRILLNFIDKGEAEDLQNRSGKKSEYEKSNELAKNQGNKGEGKQSKVE
ncbi:longevity-assurance family protein [Stylonychia lemnae]|uniref:Longevity-assurance family protein n=1 Tax=Stylonychia lemnae TaxID=5949 RepID=A0A078AWA9_STYLE|nr:longevity-assurance family protein [Stylonychia lemnae]|eukprot:CDW86361.1 longevity-assurance family protein [Stylonychia lemnae]